MKDVEINREPIELYKILKFEGMVSSGGEAKAAISSGEVRVNEVVETRKGCKMMAGDTISFREWEIKLVLGAA